MIHFTSKYFVSRWTLRSDNFQQHSPLQEIFIVFTTKHIDLFYSFQEKIYISIYAKIFEYAANKQKEKAIRYSSHLTHQICSTKIRAILQKQSYLFIYGHMVKNLFKRVLNQYPRNLIPFILIFEFLLLNLLL